MKLIDLKVEFLIGLFCAIAGIFLSIYMYFSIVYSPFFNLKTIISALLFILVYGLTIVSMIFLFESIDKLKRETE